MEEIETQAPETPAPEAPKPDAPAGIRAKRPSRAQMRLRNKKRRFRQRKVSRLSIEDQEALNYKDSKMLRTFLTPEGKILPRRITGNSAKQQRALAGAIKRARHLALLPFKSQEN
jgi:small subunit ribosomal protein S18